MLKSKTLILTKEEMALERTPDDLYDWVEQKLEEFAKSGETIRASALKHEGLFKKFYEEVWPLSLLVKHLYTGRTDVFCKPILGNQPYDAIIWDRSTKPETKLFIEFTGAVYDYDESLRMEHFLQHGHVNLTGEITRKKDGTVENEPAWASKEETIAINLNMIKERAKEKSQKNYGRDDHVLVIIYDDNLAFRYPKDHEVLKNFVSTELFPLNLDFKRLYLLGGVFGNTLFSFELGKPV